LVGGRELRELDIDGACKLTLESDSGGSLAMGKRVVEGPGVLEVRMRRAGGFGARNQISSRSGSILVGCARNRRNAVVGHLRLRERWSLKA
jgi:hypothetical protein